MGRANRARRRGLAFEQCEPRIALSGDAAATTFNFTLVSANLEGGFVEFDDVPYSTFVPGQLSSAGTKVSIGGGISLDGTGTSGMTLNFSNSHNGGDFQQAVDRIGIPGIPAIRRPDNMVGIGIAPVQIPAPVAGVPSDEGGSIDLAKVPSGSLINDPTEPFSKELLTRAKEEPKEIPSSAMVPDAEEAESLHGRAVLMEVAASVMPTQPREIMIAVSDRETEAPISLHSAANRTQEHDRADDEEISYEWLTDSNAALASRFVPVAETLTSSGSSETLPPKSEQLEIAASTPAARDRAFAEMEDSASLAVAAAVSDPKGHTFSGLAVAAVLFACRSYRGFREPVEDDPVEQRPPRRSRRFRGGNS